MTAQAKTTARSRVKFVSLTALAVVACAGLALAAGQFERRQLWETEAVQAGWRADRQVRDRRCRLVDPLEQVVIRGTGARCLNALRSLPVAPAEGQHLVLLLHGLGRSSASFRPMVRALRAEGYTPVAVSYPSLKRSLGAHADQLARIIDRTSGVEQVSFVTHSLGGLVVRELLSRERPWKAPTVVGRVVMIAPPNQGSALARGLARVPVFGWATGPSGMAVAGEEVARMRAPRADFGVIAGRGPSSAGFNPWLDGDDDGIVRVAETRLAGSRDSMVARGLHSFIMSRPEVVTATIRFLATGRFRSDPNH